MHAPNLLKIVLKHRNIGSGPSSHLSTSKKGKGGSENGSCDKQLTRSPSDSVLAAGPAATKMACLCAPTKHAGSFRCRLHRAGQTQWASPGSPAPTTVSKPDKEKLKQETQATPAAISILDLERPSRGHKKRAPTTFRSASLSPPASPEGRPSRLSRVVVADSVDEGAVPGYKKVSVSSTAESSVTGGFSKCLARSGASTSGVSETLVR